MPQMWTEDEKEKLQKINDTIATHPSADEMKARANAEREAEYERPGSTASMNNRELQQAIRETFEMWAKTPPEYDSGGNIEKHFNTLLNLQLIRARGGYVEQR